MKYILDSSVAVKWVLVEPYWDKANLLRDDYRNAIHELVSPDVLPVEVMHALTKAERQKRISVNQGGILWADVMATCPKLVPYLPLIPRAYDIASQLRIGIYDCIYVACAEEQKCELLTTDDKLLKNAQQQFPLVRHLSTLP